MNCPRDAPRPERFCVVRPSECSPASRIRDPQAESPAEFLVGLADLGALVENRPMWAEFCPLGPSREWLSSSTELHRHPLRDVFWCRSFRDPWGVLRCDSPRNRALRGAVNDSNGIVDRRHACLKVPKYFLPDRTPDPGFAPVRKSPPARHTATDPEAFGYRIPGDSCSENEDDSREAIAVGDSGASAFRLGSFLRKRQSDSIPVFIGNETVGQGS